jgi:hypothetical protein
VSKSSMDGFRTKVPLASCMLNHTVCLIAKCVCEQIIASKSTGQNPPIVQIEGEPLRLYYLLFPGVIFFTSRRHHVLLHQAHQLVPYCGNQNESQRCASL